MKAIKGYGGIYAVSIEFKISAGAIQHIFDYRTYFKD